MKTKIQSYRGQFALALVPLLLSAAAFFCTLSQSARAATLFVGLQAGAPNGSVGTYDAAGAVINSSFITGLDGPQGLLLSGNTLYVADYLAGRVGTYNATTGAAINASFISGAGVGNPDSFALLGNLLYVASINGTVGVYNAITGAAINANLIAGLTNPQGLALLGNNLFVTDSFTNSVGKYDAITGLPINASFISGLNGPVAMALHGNDLFVTSLVGGTVGKYDAITGAVISASFIPGFLNGPDGLAISGNSLFLSQLGGTVGEYNATTGAAINATLITGLNQPVGIAVQSTPEPASCALLGLGALLLAARRRQSA